MADGEGRRRRSGGRAAQQARRGKAAIEQMPWRMPQLVDPPVEPLSPEGVAAIHDGAMRILEEIGIVFLNDEALGLFRDAGCQVDGNLVRMGRDFVMEMVGKAPSSFTITPRNPDRQIEIGENTFIGHSTQINVGSRFRIGRDSLVAPMCLFTDARHNFEEPDSPIKEQGATYTPIEIGDGVWIGASCGASCGAGRSAFAGGISAGAGAAVWVSITLRMLGRGARASAAFSMLRASFLARSKA